MSSRVSITSFDSASRIPTASVSAQRTSSACTALTNTVFLYDNEFRPPWEDPELWIRLSYPFFHADRIRTPTVYLGGDKDFNVPIIGGEQDAGDGHRERPMSHKTSPPTLFVKCGTGRKRQ